MPGPILAQVSQNVFDSATGKYLLIPQGTRLIGIYQNASTYGQQRVEIAWQRLVFPNTSSMDLPQMPGADQGGYSGFTDEVNNHYLRTFGTAAVMSLISAGQMVGQMATFGGGGTYGPYGYSQPNQWAMASQTAGSAASGQFGSVGQQMIGQGMNRPTDDRDPARLPVQRDGHRGPCVPGGLQKLNVHKSYTERTRDCARNVHKTDSRRRAMGVLKRKEEPTETITLRVPASVKAEIDRLRERTSEAGFDLNATICESIIRLTRQMRDEMDGLEGKTAGSDRSRKPATANGLAHSDRKLPASSADGQGGV